MPTNAIRRLYLFIAVVTAALVSALTVVAQERQPAEEIRPPVYDAQTRLNWHAQHLEMRSVSPFKDLKWKHIGPTLMSGRITDIAKPADQPHTFYVASASGGIWKTTNEGTTWQPLFDDAPSGSVGAIAVDPADSSRIWVGLGEANIFRSSMSGTGVYLSQDSGQTWRHMGLPESHHIARIVIHPTNSNIVYVDASGHEYTENPERGIYKTTDGGQTWDLVLFEHSKTGAIDLVIDPHDPETLYASMWHRIRRPWNDPIPGPGGGIYKTTDGGENWERLTAGLPPRETSGRIGIAIAATNPQVLYALIDSHEVARKANENERDAYGRPREDVIRGAVVYRSDDAGLTWKQVSENNREMQRLYSTYGWVFGQIRVDPNDENVVYALGIPLMKSSDGGKSFRTLSYSKLHGDHHALWIDPKNSNYMINGNDGGINITYDGGATWRDIDNLPVVQFYNVAVDNAEPFNVYGSIQDNNSWRGPSNHRPGRQEEINWRRIPGGEASYVQIDPEDPNVLFSESFYGSIMRTDMSTGQSQSIVPKAADGEPPLRGQWLAPFQLSPHNSRIVYHGMQYVFRSMNRGEKWERISPDLTYYDPSRQGNISYATISTLAESPLRFGLIYAGTDDGRLHVTQDGGDLWTEIVEGLPPNKWFSRVVPSKFDEGTVYVTQNGKCDNDFQTYVYRSTDFGKTWQDIGHGIPGGPVNVIREDPFAKNVLYVGTDLGVYATNDSAKTWHVLGTGLPITFVHDLVVHTREKTMVVATHGRGMFTLDIRELKRNNEPLNP
jgi:photosystem II stability/assembly factor-like uncharacterized protein